MLLVLLLSASLAQTPPPTGTVRGIVVDARDGTPLRQVSVRLPGGISTLTGDDGRFELVGAPAGTQELYVSVVDFILDGHVELLRSRRRAYQLESPFRLPPA